MKSSALNEIDRLRILSPTAWPYLFLPLKRFVGAPGNAPELACLVTGTDDEKAPLTIRLANMFDSRTDVPTREYENVDSLLRDGWVVD